MSGHGRGGFIVRNRIKIASVVVPVVAVTSLIVYAVTAKPHPVEQAHLNDAGVWVSTDQTTETGAMFGQINVPASQFASTLVPPTGTSSVDVLQDNNAVIGVDGAGTLTPIDPAGLRLDSGDQVKIGSDDAAVGGNDESGTLAVADPVNGGVWATTFDSTQGLTSISAIDPSSKPAAHVGSKPSIAVANTGSVFAVSATVGLTKLSSEAGKWASTVQHLPAQMTGNLSVTTVGAQPVVMAESPTNDTPTLLLPNGRVVELLHDAPAGSAILQQPGPSVGVVLVETSRALLEISISSGSIRQFPVGTGQPVAPVEFQQCEFAAWEGSQPIEARVCGGTTQTKPLISSTGAAITDLVFRVDHEELLLNDRASGQVWNDQAGNPTQIADWQAVQPPAQNKNQSGHQNITGNQDKTKAPQANPDNLGARPGRQTILHVLDNDKTPAATVLTVNDVLGITSRQASARVSPDGQSVLLTLDPTASGTFSFMYDDSNGGSKISNKARVTVHVVQPATLARPTLRTGYTEPTWHVPVNGIVTIPVISDWRDYPTGDVPALGSLASSVTHLAGSAAISTSDGSIVYSAGSKPGNDRVDYTVWDGDRPSHPASLRMVVDPDTGRPRPPTAENDYVQATVGKPITIEPLANDLPGSNPVDPTATLKISGVIRGQAGITVEPTAPDGSVTLLATRQNQYKLSYQDSYGPVNSKPAYIRVDAEPADQHAMVQAAPDAVTVHGEAPTLMDPLANDSSPLGGLLTVVGEKVSNTSNLEVAVVQGHWLRVNDRQPVTQPTSETFNYSVSDGSTTASAQVTVNELPPPPTDTPIAETDYATVRMGDSVTIPVLDNDVDPGGEALSLARNNPGAPAPGQLVVHGPTGAPLGQAFVSGNAVRYIAPTGSVRQTESQQATIDYNVQNGSSGAVTGHAVVTITPPGTAKTDSPPSPADLTARVVAGGSVTIPVPTSGVDPDGDTVQVDGLAKPASGSPQPTLGAVIGYTANSITYQAYPAANNSGTDTFNYQVVDPYGLSGTGTIRVAVVQPTVLPPPVAHEIDLTAAPGSRLSVDVVAPGNVDYPDGDAPTLLDPSKASPNASLLPKRPGWLSILVPKSAPGHIANVPYSVVGDLGHPSGSTIVIHVVPGYRAPPVVVDEFAKPKQKAAIVKVNLLAGDFDPAGGALHIKSPVAPGGELKVQLRSTPQVIPFVVASANGATATAVAYIPATGTGSTPYWNGKVITIPSGKKTLRAISQYVIDPAGARVELTEKTHSIWSSPAVDLTASVRNGTTIELEGSPGYQGPASVTFAVTRTKDLNAFNLITVPVIIGRPAPVLRCPTDVIDIQQGLVDGSTISPAAECHVWTPPNISASSLRFRLSWAKPIGRVSFPTNNQAQDVVFADHNAVPGTPGKITVAIDGFSSSKTAVLNALVVPAPPLLINPISQKGILATGPATVIPLAQYVSSPFGPSAISIVHISKVPNVQITQSGPATLKISTNDKQLHGSYQIIYTVTDLSNLHDSRRWKTGTINLQFIGVPGVPTSVAPRPGFESQQVVLTWTAPQPNGDPNLNYKVDYRAQGASSDSGYPCGTTSCSVHPLKNGRNYYFRVSACNSAGCSKPSGWAGPGTPDEKPGQVGGVHFGRPEDGQLALDWNPITGLSSTNQFKYVIAWGPVAGDSNQHTGTTTITSRQTHTFTIPNLLNDYRVSASIVASNRAGQGAVATATGESAGKPHAPTMSSNSFTPNKTADGEAAVDVSWSAVDANGPGPTTYTLDRTDNDGTHLKVVCSKSISTTCADTFATTGAKYKYSVTAHNGDFDSDPSSPPAIVEASTQPDTMDAPTVDNPNAATADGTLTIHYTTVPSHGIDLKVDCSYTTNGNVPDNNSPACPGSPFPTSYPVGGGTTDSQTLSGVGNAVNVRFALWEDNGSTQNSAFRYGLASSPSVSVRTNGPPNPPTGASCGLSGDTVTFSWNAPASNGRPVTYTYSGALSGTTSGTSVSHTYPEDAQSHTLNVRAVDSANELSSALAVTCKDKTPPPPGTPGAGSCGLSGSTIIFNWTAPGSNGETPYTYHYSGALSGTTGGTSAQGNFPASGQNQTLNVYATDQLGQQSGTRSLTCPEEVVQPSITASLGDSEQPGTCSGSCRDLNFQVHNFPVNRFTWQCNDGNGQYYNSANSGKTINITSANESFTNVDYCADTNQNVTITIDGVTSTPAVHL